MSNTLNVNNNTSLQNLQDFMGKANVGDRVRARMVDGSVQLYTKPAATGLVGLLKNLAPSAIQSRAMGRAAIQTIFDNQQTKSGEAVSSNVRKAVDPGFARDVKVGGLTVLAEIASKVTLRKTEDLRPGPALATFGLSKQNLDAEIVSAAAQLAGGVAKEDVALSLGTALAAGFNAGSPTKEERDDCTLSLGMDFCRELKQALTAAGLDKESIDNGFLLSVYDAAASQVGNCSMDGDNFHIGDKTYVKSDLIGKGGNGIVYAYVNVNDPGDRLAIKTPMSERGDVESDMDTDKEALSEIEGHLRAQGSGHQNVLGMEGAVHLPGGGFGVVMKVADYGDMGANLKYIDHELKSGTITDEQATAAKLTLLKDSFDGLEHVHSQGVVHRDLKPGNFFLASDGVLKVADFGAVRSIDRYDGSDMGGITPAFIAPDGDLYRMDAETVRDAFAGMKGDKFQSNGQAISTQSPMAAAADAILKSQIPGLSKSDRAALLSSYQAAASQNVMSSSHQPVARDMYAMGASAYQALYAKTQFEDEPGRIGALLEKYAANPDNRLVNDLSSRGVSGPSPQTKSESDTTTLFNLLIQQTTSPNTHERLNATQAAAHPVFQTKGVGEPETRDLIKKIAVSGQQRDAVEKQQRLASAQTPPVAAPADNGSQPTFVPSGAQTAPASVFR